MTYPEQLIGIMRQDLTQYGIDETRTPAAVDEALRPGTGKVLMVVNSVCGCAAAKARPGVGMALANSARPDRAVTVFAGGDVDAVAHLRAKHLANIPPSSPSITLFDDGQPVFHVHRSQIESRGPEQIAALLKEAFDEHCSPKPVTP